MSFATNLHHQASNDRTIPVLLQPEYSGSVLGPDASNKQPAVNNAARCERVTMSSDAASPASEQVGPLERKYLKHANYRAVTDGVKVSKDTLAYCYRQRSRLGLRRHGRRDL